MQIKDILGDSLSFPYHFWFLIVIRSEKKIEGINYLAKYEHEK